VPKVGNPFNPYRLFYGVFIPEALVRYAFVSPGAKLCYGRLIRYAGEKGKCFPSQEALARELGVSVRNVRRYIQELRSKGFIRTVRQGLQSSNEYEFLWHPIFDGSERTDSSYQNRTNAASPNRPEPSAPSRKESVGRESSRRKSASSSPDPSLFTPEKRSHNGLSRFRVSDLNPAARELLQAIRKE